jgi:hypothetical protein
MKLNVPLCGGEVIEGFGVIKRCILATHKIPLIYKVDNAGSGVTSTTTERLELNIYGINTVLIP